MKTTILFDMKDSITSLLRDGKLETAMASKTKHGSEVIAFHLGWNWDDVKDGRYQRYTPPIYVCGSDYFCCPSKGAKPPAPKEFVWKEVGEHDGRKVYCSLLDDMNAREA